MTDDCWQDFIDQDTLSIIYHAAHANWRYFLYVSKRFLINLILKYLIYILLSLCWKDPIILYPVWCLQADILALFCPSTHIKHIKCKTWLQPYAGLFSCRIWYWYLPSSTSARCMRPGGKCWWTCLPCRPGWSGEREHKYMPTRGGEQKGKM